MDRVNNDYNISIKYNVRESRDFQHHSFSGIEWRQELISSGFYIDKIFEKLILLYFIHVDPSSFNIGVLVRVVA